MNSVDNVARVLRLFTPDRSVLSVTEVAQLDLPKSSSSRLLKAMAETGLLAATGQGAGYSVGNLIFETSRRHRAHSTLSVIADEALAQIVKATGHTGYIAMLDRTEVLGLRMRPGSKPLRVVTSPGDRLPAFCSSTGRAMLARLEDEAVRAFYPAPWQPPSPNAPQTIDDLLTALATVREKGWSQATDEILPGVEIDCRVRRRPRERRARRALHLLFRRHDLGQREVAHRHAADAGRLRDRHEIRRRALGGAALRRLLGAILE